MGEQSRKKGKKVRSKAICGEANCGFRTRDGGKMGAHTRKYKHQFRTQIRK
jgi:hypothetical protein